MVLINSFNQIGQQLGKLQTDMNTEITSSGGSDKIWKQIAELNMKIKTNEIMGDHANDYRDQRNLLLDKLSKIVDI
jgi:flagellar hook-associated protein 1 FlgK